MKEERRYRMTVKDLKKELDKYPDEMIVARDGDSWGLVEIDGIEKVEEYITTTNLESGELDYIKVELVLIT